MNSSIDSKLGFGPMSAEVIEAVIKASLLLEKSFMLISTQNQVDWNGGYVNNWNTKEYVDFVDKLKKKYKLNAGKGQVYLCRDHCGPGFRTNSIEEVYKTIYDDIENGFDLIHIDFSKFSRDKEVVLEETKKVIEKIFKINPCIKIEIGTEENIGTLKDSIKEIEEEFNFFKDVLKPEFYVIQTGSLVREIYQFGIFNRKFIDPVHDFLQTNGVKLKEHNADYLDNTSIKERKGIVDAMNIAPQLGVLQTTAVINEALNYGKDIRPFLECSYSSKKWKKWLYKETGSNRMLCSIIAGHYNFTTDEYKRLICELEKYVDINDLIINKVLNLIKYYSGAF